MSTSNRKSYKLAFYSAALITALIPYAYLRIICLWECSWNLLPRLALAIIVSSISMVFSYQNLAISKFSQLQRRYDIQPASSQGKKGSLDGKKSTIVDVKFLEKMAIWHAIGTANFGFLLIFLGLTRAVLEPLALSRNIIISTVTPAFILAFFTRL